MFQIVFEEGEWRDWVMACFVCTSCAQRNYFIPEMPDPPLRGADISREFLVSYQKNFRFMVFEYSKDLVELEYNEKVICKPLVVTKRRRQVQPFAQVGGQPKWLLEDETPARLAGHPPVFLMNIFEDKSFQSTTFQIEDSAPRQMELSLSGVPEPSEDLCYKLFLGNSIYFFGTTGDERMVYAFTQTD